MADEVRLIDANSVCKKIVESIRCAEEWANEAKEQQDTHGLRCATEAKTSLLAMLARIHDEPTIEAEPVNGWISVKDRLPEYDKTVLVVNEDGYMHTAVRIKGSIARIDEWQIKFGVYFIDNDVWEEDEQGKITHWQPLPEPPKGE